MLGANGSNDLLIEFESPVIHAERAYQRQARDHYPVPPECVADQYNGECHANHIRKMQASVRPMDIFHLSADTNI